MGTTLYQYYDATEVLLYVGITDRGHARASEHAKGKPWWPEVARGEMEHFQSRDRALQREAFLITTLRPRYNIQHNVTRSAKLIETHRRHIPSDVMRIFMGRLARQVTAEEVDPEALTKGTACEPYRQTVLAILRMEKSRNASAADLRVRLKRLEKL